MSYWDALDRHTQVDEFWMSHPAVRARINLRVSGDPAVWPTTWLARRLAGKAPLERTFSIGCGIGNFERDVVRQGIVRQITGIDVSPSCIVEARGLAAHEALDSQITYDQTDARERLRTERDLDAIFFHASLHHFDGLPELLGIVRQALKPEGILYLDEYIGPSRDEWPWRSLVIPNLAYYLLPKSVRRVGLIRAPINYEDPTEAIQSSQIMAAVEEHFDVVERRDYGGNLVSLIYANLWRPNQEPGSPPEDFDESMGLLLDLEEALFRHPRITRSPSWHAIVLASPKASHN